MSEAPAVRLGARTTPHRIQRLWHRIGYPASGAHADDGFTLLEVVVSFIIFAIVATAATYGVANGITYSRATGDRVGAANVAQQELEKARAMPQASLTATPTVTSTSTVGSQRFTIVRSVGYGYGISSCPTPNQALDTTPREITVEVDVTPASNKDRSVKMNTVIAC